MLEHKFRHSIKTLNSNWLKLFVACNSQSECFISAIHSYARGSGCGAVGRAVSSDPRDPQLKHRDRQFYLQSTVIKSKK